MASIFLCPQSSRFSALTRAVHFDLIALSLLMNLSDLTPAPPRGEIFKRRGLKELRFSNDEVVNDPEAVR
ncbi:MAG: hypothetical protein A2W19_03130 [Spirochaetes bacterium RBG_16_49_21]|nr:MAG: hypothetical protein A2W19_03130 [Spirochaetes bacterium RBG_16_49_21]